MGSMHDTNACVLLSENPEEDLRQFEGARGGQWLRWEDAAQQHGQVWAGTAGAMSPTTGSSGI